MVLAMPVLLLLLLGTIEMGMRVYYRAQVRSAATAAALAAVGTQVHWPIPIPKKWVIIFDVPIPVDGIVINTLHLPNVDWGGDVRGEALETRNLTNSNIKFATTVLPWALAPSPLKWVNITASVSPPQVFSRIFRAGPVEESACAIAWIRPDYWEHGWWDKKSQQSLFGIGDKDYRYYRLVPCGLLGAGDSLEAVLTAYVQDTGDGTAPQWSKDAFPDRMPKLDSESDSPPPVDEKVDQCTKDRANCKPKAQTFTCQTDHKTQYTIEPQPWQEGQERPTRDQYEAKHCPPPPPPPPDEKKEGSP
jgi:hypothetical protein